MFFKLLRLVAASTAAAPARAVHPIAAASIARPADPSGVERLRRLRAEQEVRGTRAWAEQQIRLASNVRNEAVSLRRVNALLVVNGFPPAGANSICMEYAR